LSHARCTTNARLAGVRLNSRRPSFIGLHNHDPIIYSAGKCSAQLVQRTQQSTHHTPAPAPAQGVGTDIGGRAFMVMFMFVFVIMLS
jgi:hypothetical protein